MPTRVEDCLPPKHAAHRRHWLLVGLVAAVVGVVVFAEPAEASVFENGKRWTPTPRPGGGKGFVTMSVCIIEGSSAEQKGDGADKGLIHDPNPSLATVLSHVRGALADSWERWGGVRFVGWQPCNELSQQQRAEVVGLYIHPEADNKAYVGTGAKGRISKHDPGVQFQPWGASFNRCIKYNAKTTHVEYHFDCVEQYAIHEFGHALGFRHENQNPAADDDPDRDCADGERTVSSWDRVLDPNTGFTVVNPGRFDGQSIMVYDNNPCVDQATKGVRFGSTRLSPTDIRGLQAVYPRVDDVGLLRGAKDCGAAEAVTIYMDDQDDTAEARNITQSSGWTGASTTLDSDGVNRNTTLEFCRADGSKFQKLTVTGAKDRQLVYAVLKLGQVCPAGSVELIRTFDNEDDNNDNRIQGDAWPNSQGFTFAAFRLKPATTLHLCLFIPALPGSTMASFPVLGYPYGVFAPADFAAALDSGWILTDDEDTDNANDFTWTCPHCQSWSDSIKMAGLVGDSYPLVIDTGRNTTLRLVKIWPRPITVQPNIQGRLGAANWFTSDVTVRWSINDPDGVEGTRSGCARVTVTNDTTGRTFTCTVTSVHGETVSETVTITRDANPPAVVFSQQPAANAHGWNHTAVQLSWSCSDAVSGVSGATAKVSELANEGAGQTDGFVCRDVAGNAARDERSIDIDMTAPHVAFVGQSPPANEYGWNNTDVTLSWHCTDALAGVDPASSAPAHTLQAEGTGQTATGTCTDLAGNTTRSTDGMVSIDKTPPEVTLLGQSPPANEYGWNNTDVTATFGASDALSGIDGPTQREIVFTDEGANQSARQDFFDLAGNHASAAVPGVFIDKTPPLLSCSTDPETLWPANHKLVDVHVTIDLQDPLSGADHFILTRVESSEPDDAAHSGDGATTGDIRGFEPGGPDVDGMLRAERDARRQGRVYTATYEGFDRAGNPASCDTRVRVPRDQRGRQRAGAR